MIFSWIKSIVLIILLTSCRSQGIKFDPNFHVGDSTNEAIIPRNPYPIVSCKDPAFEEFACMHISKIEELKEILLKAKIDPKMKVDLFLMLDSHLE